MSTSAHDPSSYDISVKNAITRGGKAVVPYGAELLRRGELKKHLVFNIAAALFLLAFGYIYESFSHGVHSPFMTYAFTVPLLAGAGVYAVLLAAKKYPARATVLLWNSCIAAFSVGSVFKGVLDIYGTTNSLIFVYPAAGGALLLAALVSVPVTAMIRKHNG